MVNDLHSCELDVSSSSPSSRLHLQFKISIRLKCHYLPSTHFLGFWQVDHEPYWLKVSLLLAMVAIHNSISIKFDIMAMSICLVGCNSIFISIINCIICVAISIAKTDFLFLIAIKYNFAIYN